MLSVHGQFQGFGGFPSVPHRFSKIQSDQHFAPSVDGRNPAAVDMLYYLTVSWVVPAANESLG